MRLLHCLSWCPTPHMQHGVDIAYVYFSIAVVAPCFALQACSPHPHVPCHLSNFEPVMCFAKTFLGKPDDPRKVICRYRMTKISSPTKHSSVLTFNKAKTCSTHVIQNRVKPIAVNLNCDQYLTNLKTMQCILKP